MTKRTIAQGLGIVALSLALLIGPAQANEPKQIDSVLNNRPTTTTTTRMVTIVCPIHPADECMEDEVFAPIDYRDPRGIEVRGVTRACVAIDEYDGWED